MMLFFPRSVQPYQLNENYYIPLHTFMASITNYLVATKPLNRNIHYVYDIHRTNVIQNRNNHVNIPQKASQYIKKHFGKEANKFSQLLYEMNDNEPQTDEEMKLEKIVKEIVENEFNNNHSHLKHRLKAMSSSDNTNLMNSMQSMKTYQTLNSLCSMKSTSIISQQQTTQTRRQSMQSTNSSEQNDMNLFSFSTPKQTRGRKSNQLLMEEENLNMSNIENYNNNNNLNNFNSIDNQENTSMTEDEFPFELERIKLMEKFNSIPNNSNLQFKQSNPQGMTENEIIINQYLLKYSKKSDKNTYVKSIPFDSYSDDSVCFIRINKPIYSLHYIPDEIQIIRNGKVEKISKTSKDLSNYIESLVLSNNSILVPNTETNILTTNDIISTNFDISFAEKIIFQKPTEKYLSSTNPRIDLIVYLSLLKFGYFNNDKEMIPLELKYFEMFRLHYDHFLKQNDSFLLPINCFFELNSSNDPSLWIQLLTNHQYSKIFIPCRLNDKTILLMIQLEKKIKDNLSQMEEENDFADGESDTTIESMQMNEKENKNEEIEYDTNSTKELLRFVTSEINQKLMVREVSQPSSNNTNIQKYVEFV